MSAEEADGFADNWAYLRTELHWIERLLMAAVAKQRKESREIERVAQSKADRATSHWWKGIITAEGEISYDEYRQPSSNKTSHQQHMEAQVQASQRRGVILALPALRERLGLSLFEKNVVLMSLAPEVNRRYARLYRYLQGEDRPLQTDLPTLDLVLRILCRNDQEWRSARNHLISRSRLTQRKLLLLLPTAEETLLNSSLKLTEPLVNYLLLDKPTPQALDDLLKNCPETEAIPTTTAPTIAKTATPLVKVVRGSSLVFLRETTPPAAFVELPIVESPTIAGKLQGLEQRIRGSIKASQQWGVQPITPPGLMVLLTGDAVAEKLVTAAKLAAGLKTRLRQVDLAAVDLVDYAELLEEIAASASKVLLIESAHLWLKRSSLLPTAVLQRFLTERRQIPAITLLSVTHAAGVHCHWLPQMDQQIDFCLPDQAERLQLWTQAFPSQVPLESTINWPALAKLPLSRGEIWTIAQETIAYAAAQDAEKVSLAHILQALAQRGKPAKIQPLASSKQRSTKPKS